MKQTKPIIHGRDHAAGGADPIPGLSGGGGIQFDTDPQSGDWLLVSTTGQHGGSGIKLETDDTGTLDLNSDNSVSVYDSGGGGIYLTSVAGGSGGGYIGIASDGELFLHGDVVLRSRGGDFEFQNSGGFTWAIFGNAQGAFFQIGSGEFFDVDLTSGGTFSIEGLTTSNPGGSGRVWNSGGVLHIT